MCIYGKVKVLKVQFGVNRTEQLQQASAKEFYRHSFPVRCCMFKFGDRSNSHFTKLKQLYYCNTALGDAI